ncbi:hypothetical protein [Microbispora triticiradicis]|uniref:hypothetical protein n=1 Tax=Microbispora triticiradicis TaxID=2200763 RepID=UPI001AD79B8A|nr:hypothetical protein [Microbispora triticiradicis]MBO4275097.1 hypothetical protein [Microbispora triticiradicis]
MTTFAQVHHGDKLQVRRPSGVLSDPYRLLTDPAACGDSTCSYLHCNAVDGMGHVEPLAEPGDAQVWFLEYGPASQPSECAGRSAEVVAENGVTGGAQ